MCLICSQLKKGVLSLDDAQKNVKEMSINPSSEVKQHLGQVQDLIEAKEHQQLRFLEIWSEGGD